MVRTVLQGDLHVHNGVASQDTGLHSALDTLVDGRDVLLGNIAADNGVDELIALAALVGLDVDA